MFYYDSPIGRIVIKYINNRYYIIINSDYYGPYTSAVAAADDVYCHATGCFEWDILDCDIDDVPTDIYEWIRVK